jgi:hypothetical protein
LAFAAKELCASAVITTSTKRLFEMQHEEVVDSTVHCILPFLPMSLPIRQPVSAEKWQHHLPLG